jgi:hypothetical protein
LTVNGCYAKTESCGRYFAENFSRATSRGRQQTFDPQEGISGLGGTAPCVAVETTLHLSRETGKPVAFKGQFTAVTDPIALDISVLGRDILDLFAVIVDRTHDVVCLLSQQHTYTVSQE